MRKKCEKLSLSVWKKDHFLYNPGMPKFTTKRLPGAKEKQKEAKVVTIDTEPKIAKSYSWKYLGLGALLLSVWAFSLYAYDFLFQTNSKNGSEIYTPPSIIEEFVNEKVEWTTNILIAGIGGKWHDGADLTDSIMLASLNGETKHITLLSIPRDLYVSYGEKWGAWRINTLYDLGKRDKVGIKYLADKVREITGQQIDQYVVIDFSGFKEVIDILWWVDIDVPEDLIDREYPDNNWGYTTFSVKKWLQTFDGETALKYARSRHSTSDFDRSNRQQLILKAIKEKAKDLGYITSPDKIADLYNAIISHLDTDLSLVRMGELAFSFRDVESKSIKIISLSDYCLSITKCSPGSYLYSPSRELFGGQAVIIPENAHATRLSYYDDIRRFVDMIFRFPNLTDETRDIVVVTDPSMKKRAEEITYGLAKIGFPLTLQKPIITATGTIEKSHINIYWHPDLTIGIDPSSTRVVALKYIEEAIPYSIVEHNEYINTSGPKVEIVLGKDAWEYFTFIKNPYYLPIVPKSTLSGESSWSTASWKITPPKWTQNTPSPKSWSPVSGEKKTQAIQAWEWEDF